jgi:hypothetical protein
MSAKPSNIRQTPMSFARLILLPPSIAKLVITYLKRGFYSSIQLVLNDVMATLRALALLRKRLNEGLFPIRTVQRVVGRFL